MIKDTAASQQPEAQMMILGVVPDEERVVVRISSHRPARCSTTRDDLLVSLPAANR